MDIEIVNIILVAINIIFIFISSIYLAKLNTKLDIQKNKKNRLQELEIEYILDYWKKRIELNNKIFDFILFLDINAHSASSHLEKYTAFKNNEEIYELNKSLESQFNSIKFFFPDKAIEIINEINIKSHLINVNLTIVSSNITSIKSNLEQFKLANRIFNGEYSDLHFKLYNILKEYFYEDYSLITKIKKWFIKIFKKPSP